MADKDSPNVSPSESLPNGEIIEKILAVLEDGGEFTIHQKAKELLAPYVQWAPIVTSVTTLKAFLNFSTLGSEQNILSGMIAILENECDLIYRKAIHVQKKMTS
ncbi:hypothetical protein Pan153_23980 [Gimesia panareensis]|uniref:Uncharacterized protein n=1 Tax=Gimesia panareensis TaxID=2527978 RepID=A0A518FN10_9PLAN|nr:hypothetical protein [Gimesia panareensis]QDV17743.1 hypothetical protein Pan153_23980 [Gimesia panareensis]